MNAPFKGVCAAFAVAFGVGFVLPGNPSAAGRTAAPQAQAPATAGAPGSGFVGDDTCTACHEGEGKNLSRGIL